MHFEKFCCDRILFKLKNTKRRRKYTDTALHQRIQFYKSRIKRLKRTYIHTYIHTYTYPLLHITIILYQHKISRYCFSCFPRVVQLLMPLVRDWIHWKSVFSDSAAPRKTRRCGTSLMLLYPASSIWRWSGSKGRKPRYTVGESK